MDTHNNKTHFTDTVKDMKENPKEALKEDYNQTKADMQNVKERIAGEDKEKDTDETMM